MCRHHLLYSFYTLAVDHSATRTYMDKISKHLAKFICSPPFPHKFNVGGQQGAPLRTDKISKHHDVNFHSAFNIELGGRGAKHARCFTKVFGYYVHLLSKNICGTCDSWGKLSCRDLRVFVFAVVVASSHHFGGNGDEPKLILCSGVSWYVMPACCPSLFDRPRGPKVMRAFRVTPHDMRHP